MQPHNIGNPAISLQARLQARPVTGANLLAASTAGNNFEANRVATEMMNPDESYWGLQPHWLLASLLSVPLVATLSQACTVQSLPTSVSQLQAYRRSDRG
jgi:hypothetical protein